jgi:hypothetical protein
VSLVRLVEYESFSKVVGIARSTVGPVVECAVEIDFDHHSAKVGPKLPSGRQRRCSPSDKVLTMCKEEGDTVLVRLTERLPK